MSITLYYAPRTRALRPRWLLEELGLPYELVRIDTTKGEQRKPEYLRIHPLGSIPALVDAGETVIESAAICLHLADRHGEGKTLAPALSSPLRARYYQFIAYAVSTLEPVVAPAYLRGLRLPEARRAEITTDEEHERFAKTAIVLRPAVAAGRYLLGDTFTTADILVGSVLVWASAAGLTRSSPELAAYLERLTVRSAYLRASID